MYLVVFSEALICPKIAHDDYLSAYQFFIFLVSKAVLPTHGFKFFF